jgi:hypothetical protein
LQKQQKSVTANPDGCTRRKKWHHPILAPTWKATDHIQTVIPANRSKVFCLTQDWGSADFYDILVNHSLKEDLSKDTNFDPY